MSLEDAYKYPPSIEDLWLEGEERMSNISPNGNDGLHYDNSASEVVDEEDAVNHPTHYTSHPSGIEAIQITEHMDFCLGNAIKYILRCENKGNKEQDLEKAIWYLQREISLCKKKSKR